MDVSRFPDAAVLAAVAEHARAMAAHQLVFPETYTGTDCRLDIDVIRNEHHCPSAGNNPDSPTAVHSAVIRANVVPERVTEISNNPIPGSSRP
jgi:hypothetical protein